MNSLGASSESLVLPPQAEMPINLGRPAVSGFEWGPKGLYEIQPGRGKDEDGNPNPPVSVWIAPPFKLPGLVRDGTSYGWHVEISWNDLDGVPHEEPLGIELMSGEGADLARMLGRGGMVLPPDSPSRKALLRYLCKAVPEVKNRVRSVDALGWHEGAFILPGGQTIGQTGEPVRYTGDVPRLRAKPTLGTFDGWKTGVARYAVGNPHLAFSIACAFAGPLMTLVRPDGGGGFNLQGESSAGKSTCLHAAVSVWRCPDPLVNWRATSSGLEGLCAVRNDGFLELDELKQIDPKEAGQAAYLIANGTDKARGAKEGGNRVQKQWRLVFLSSGEIGLEDKLSEDGKKPMAGMEVRVPDIPCPVGGMFADSYDFPTMEAFAENLKAQARKHYGHAIRIFLQNLCDEWAHRDSLQERLKKMEAAWLAVAIPKGASAQVRRVAGRFALVAVAGALAQSMKILPWPDCASEEAALVCFKSWLDRRGFSGAFEVHRGIDAVLSFLEKHGQSRSDEWGDKNRTVINRAGTRKRAEGGDDWDYYITSAAWAEACTGLPARDVARACEEEGILEVGKPDPKKKTHSRSQSVPIPGHGKARAYVIRAVAIAKYQEGDAA